MDTDKSVLKRARQQILDAGCGAAGREAERVLQALYWDSQERCGGGNFDPSMNILMKNGKHTGHPCCLVRDSLSTPEF